MQSPTLSLYLLAARRGSGASAATLPPRPEGGPLIWMHLDVDSSAQGLAQLARRMQGARPDLTFLATAEAAAPDIERFPPGSVAAVLPADRLPDLRAFLDRFAPALVLLTGPDLPPALIHSASERGIPVALADLAIADGAPLPWRWTAGMAAALLRQMGPILVADRATERVLARIAGPGLPVAVTGRVEATLDPPGHDEAERAALAEIIEARPVWLAADLPEAEEDGIIAAHQRILRFAHRALLVLAPADPARAGPLAARIEADGMEVARRSADEDPDGDVQVLLADLPGELGLWYRLTPVTYLGGTLSGTTPGRSPEEPAGLGSAILHGPKTAAHAAAYARLTAARATQRVATAEALAVALADLIAPDRSAQLAYNAWAAATTGAEVRERVMQRLFERLDAGTAAGAT